MNALHEDPAWLPTPLLPKWAAYAIWKNPQPHL